MPFAQHNHADLRQATRHRADFKTIMERPGGGEQFAHICNVSANGFMIDDASGIDRGDRVSVRFPVVGRIESYCVWAVDSRAGFQLERLVRMPDFMAMLEILNARD